MKRPQDFRLAAAAFLLAQVLTAQAEDTPAPAAPEWPAGVLLLLNTQGLDTLHALNEMAPGTQRDSLIEKISSAGPEDFEAVARILNESGLLSADGVIKMARRVKESLNRSGDDTVAAVPDGDLSQTSTLSASGRTQK